MKKIISLTSLAMLTASAALAGAIEYIAPAAPVMIEEPTGSMGSSGFWIVPAVIIVACIILCFPEDTPQDPENAR